MIELRHLRTPTTKTMQLSKRVFRSVSFAGDVHYFNHDGRGDGRGGWRMVHIDPIATPYGYEQAFGAYHAIAPLWSDEPMRFWDKRSDGLRHKNREIILSPICGRVAGIRFLGLKNPSYIYPDAFGEGSDLVYEFSRSGIRKWIRVRAGYVGEPAYRFRFLFDNGGVKVSRTGVGGYDLDRGSKLLDKPRSFSISDDDGSETFFRTAYARSGSKIAPIPLWVDKGDLSMLVEKSIPEWWDRSQDLWMDLSMNSVLASDGYLSNESYTSYATARNATSATYLVSGAFPLICNNDATGPSYVVRPYMIFWTNIPSAAVVSAFSLNLYCESITLAPDLVAVAFTPADYASVAVTDAQLGVGIGTSQKSDLSNLITAASWETWSFSSFASMLNLGGAYTGFALRDAAATIDFSGTTYAGGAQTAQFTESEDGGNVPYLTATYTYSYTTQSVWF